MDKQEAHQVATTIFESLRVESYETLVERYLNNAVHIEVVGKSGTSYQVEVDPFWDSPGPGNLRGMVAIDDGEWRAFAPLTTDFIIAPDGSFVGE